MIDSTSCFCYCLWFPKHTWNWCSLDRRLEKFYIGKNREWFFSLFGMQQKWVPAYVKDYFRAGMSTTQRSESINTFFDGYVNSRTSLKCFVEKYDCAFHAKWEKGKQEDYVQTACLVLWLFLWEAICPCIQYTLWMFDLFQRERKLLMGGFFQSIGQSSESVDKFTVNEVPTRGVVWIILFPRLTSD